MSTEMNEFKAGVYHTKYFGQVCTAITCFFIIGFIYMGEIRIAFIVILSVTLLVARLRSRRMVFNEKTFSYDGWITTHQIQYDKILKVESPGTVRYPAYKLHGPTEFRISTESNTFWISLLWFNSEASRLFRDRIVHHKRYTKQ